MFIISVSILIWHDIHGKSINLKIDSEDVVELFNSFMKSNIVKNLAEHVLRRTLGSEISYDNPYHPEDRFMLGEVSKEKLKFKNLSKDALDTGNDKFADGYISEDLLTDNGVDGSEVQQKYSNKKQNLIETQTNNATISTESKNKNETINNDTNKSNTSSFKAVLKPILRRFIVKKRND